VTRPRSSKAGETAALLLETLQLHGDVPVAALRERWAALSPAGLATLTEYEGCVLWLHRRLQELGILDAVPSAFAQWLSQRAHFVVARNLLVDAQRDDLVQILNELRVPHVLLKGGARRLVAHRYPYADARSTNDVDVLLPGNSALPTWRRLRAAGFEPTAASPATYDGHFHLPPLRNGRAVAVELHTSTSNHVPPPLAWRRLAGTAQAATCPGGPTQIPGATELLWHAITHAPLPHPVAFRLRFFQDAAVVCAAGAEVDWGEIAMRLTTDELPQRAVARRWLGTAARLAALPDEASPLRPLPAPDLSKVLSWRLSVCRLTENGGRRPPRPPPRPVWGRHPVSRVRRLFIDEAARLEFGLPVIPLHGTGALRRAGTRAVARAARLCYVAWRLFRRA
jgi:putative nucleotidyltransferase-like protein